MATIVNRPFSLSQIEGGSAVALDGTLIPGSSIDFGSYANIVWIANASELPGGGSSSSSVNVVSLSATGVVGNHDAPYTDTRHLMVGTQAVSSVPTEVQHLDAVRLWADTFGRIVMAGFNQSTNAIDVFNQNDALLTTAEAVSLNAVTAAGAGSIINGLNFNKHTFYITASSITSGGTLSIQVSYDGTNWATATLLTTAVAGIAISNNIVTISANGTYALRIEGKHKYVRVNLLTRTDGTYTATILSGN